MSCCPKAIEALQDLLTFAVGVQAAAEMNHCILETFQQCNDDIISNTGWGQPTAALTFMRVNSTPKQAKRKKRIFLNDIVCTDSSAFYPKQATSSASFVKQICWQHCE